MVARNTFGAIGRCIADRPNYRSTSAWLVSLYDRLLRRYPSIWLPFRGARYPYRVNGIDKPLLARLGSSDGLVLAEVFFEGEYESLFEQVAKDVRTIVDLGANCGFSVALWLDRFPNARILAVEPDADNLAMLKANNAEALESGRLSVVEACVGGDDRTGFLDRACGEWAYAVTDTPGKDCVRTSIRSLKNILAESKIDGTIDLLKCDIEGSERELMTTCADWLPHVRTMLIELHPPYSAELLTRAISGSLVTFTQTEVKSKGGNGVYLLQRVDNTKS